MPQIKSAIKRIKTSKKQRAGNSAAKSRIAGTRALLYEAITAGDKAKSTELFQKYCSVLDKAAKRGAIKANNASRRKSRAVARIAALN